MELVKDLKHFDSLIKEVKTQVSHIKTNCYLLPEDVEKLTRQERLFWEMESAGLFFYNEGPFLFQMYFFTEGKEIKILPAHNKPIIINLVYREPAQIAKVDILKEVWIGNGFREYKTNMRMVKERVWEKDNGPLQLDQRQEDHSIYKVSIANSKHVNNLIQLWTKNLDIYSNPLPTHNELAELLDARRIICAVDTEQRLVAAMEYDPSEHECTIQHVVVDKRDRKRGLARSMLRACYQLCMETERFVLWVAEDNSPAINLYREQGFVSDQLRSLQLISS